MSAMFANKEHNVVKNMPAYADKYRYVVARRADDWGDLWFYGAWDDEDKAREVTNEIDGMVVENF